MTESTMNRFNWDNGDIIIQNPPKESEEETEQESYKSLTPDQKLARWESFAKKSDNQEVMFKRVFENVFAEQKKQLIKSLESTGKLPEKLDDDLTAKKFEPALRLVYEDAFQSAV